MSIYIVFAILCFAVELFTVYVLFYYNNSIHLWYSDRDGYRPEIQLFMPSVTDLDYKNEDITALDIEEYEKKVVLPARDYFTQMKRLEKLNGNDNWLVGLLALVLIPIGYIIWIFRRCTNLTTIDIVIAIAIAVISVPLSFLVSHLIEKRNPKFKEFFATEDWLKREFNEHKGYNQFPISDKNALNNYIIEKHSNYIKGLEDEIRRRTMRANIACVTVFIFTCVLGYILR